ncbi:endonuclease/exonuclease/phosphatase family protein [Comamonas sp. GB3 AK4-5]|uniref:endonuclease/exonuclease/phosphatase family protein n=1 Tax=Comamonas sp. GB3 AK4-5 TaxID=3231487 RepID=UPI00351DE726
MQLLSWNVQWCCGLDAVVSPERIAAHALAMGAEAGGLDVLCLQEVAVGHGGLQGGPGDQVAQLRALLPGWQVFFAATTEGFDAQGRHRAFGNLVATRLPVAEVAQHRLPWRAEAGVVSMPRGCLVVTVCDSALGLVRVMTTHLEYHSARQRQEQVRALRALHAEALAQCAAQPGAAAVATPYATPVHTEHAVLCGDFNLEPHEAEYAQLVAPAGPGEAVFHDCWPLRHPGKKQPDTFRLFDRTWGPEPGACDFVLVSDSLQGQVRSWHTDSATQLSDHQPVCVTLG